jgi:hypothetical protein
MTELINFSRLPVHTPGKVALMSQAARTRADQRQRLMPAPLSP